MTDTAPSPLLPYTLDDEIDDQVLGLLRLAAMSAHSLGMDSYDDYIDLGTSLPRVDTRHTAEEVWDTMASRLAGHLQHVRRIYAHAQQINLPPSVTAQQVMASLRRVNASVPRYDTFVAAPGIILRAMSNMIVDQCRTLHARRESFRDFLERGFVTSMAPVEEALDGLCTFGDYEWIENVVPLQRRIRPPQNADPARLPGAALHGQRRVGHGDLVLLIMSKALNLGLPTIWYLGARGDVPFEDYAAASVGINGRTYPATHAELEGIYPAPSAARQWSDATMRANIYPIPHDVVARLLADGMRDGSFMKMVSVWMILNNRHTQADIASSDDGGEYEEEHDEEEKDENTASVVAGTRRQRTDD